MHGNLRARRAIPVLIVAGALMALAGCASAPGGTTAYVTNVGDDTVTPIDVATGQAEAPIKVGPAPDAIAVTP